MKIVLQYQLPPVVGNITKMIKSMNMYKQLLLIRSSVFLLFCLVLTSSFIELTPKDFAGHWVINSVKSQFGEVPEFVTDKEIIVQFAGDSIIIKRTGADKENNPYTVEEHANVNGNPVVTQTTDEATKTLIIKWRNENNEMEKSMSYSKPKHAGEIDKKILQIWRLSADDKNLTVTHQFENSVGKYSILVVYDRI